MPHPRRQHTAGFTLIELMIVVGILAILATVGLVSYRKYALRAKVSEAYTMLGNIRMRQETYRAEFSQYCDVSSSTHNGSSGSAAGYWPSSAPTATAVDWYASVPAEWTQLGIRPTGPVYFRYDVVAGNPGVSPSFFGSDLGYNALTNKDMWWAAHAYGNLDGDSLNSTFEAFSMTNSVWVKNSQDTE